ncbi:hypothetical protein SAMN04487936_11355 [Halobacillus dabanensis]|uniref:Uncharacterized protein n=1 Tax=Halobacillus dabanensis TaxID=240302 RepID=A0A1I3ZA82_HALDA|nr:hypothetical protein SAMN04487936_11355 [Halobacillus dabanensis]
MLFSVHLWRGIVGRLRATHMARGGGEWRDSCGKKVLGETQQDAVSEEAQRAPAESELFPAALST